MIKTHCNICDRVMQSNKIELRLPSSTKGSRIEEFNVVPFPKNSYGDEDGSSLDVCQACVIAAMQYTGIIPEVSK